MTQTAQTATRIELPYQPREWQMTVHKKMARFSVVVVHRRAGKTVFAINTLVSAACRAKRGNERYMYVAPFYTQAKDVAWSILKDATRIIPGIKYNEQESAAYFPNGARIRIYGADNEESLRGKYCDGMVIDEVAQMKPDVWESILYPMLFDYRGFAIFIGTVNGVNLLSDLYNKAANKPDWYRILLDCYHTDVLSAEDIASARAEMSESKFAREMLCDFNAASDDVLISLQSVVDAQNRHYELDDYKFAPRILTCDVARYGDDRSVICRGQGLVVHPLQVYKKIDNMALADKLATQYELFRPDACFIDAGRGEGVIDRMRQLGFDVQGVDFGGESGSPEYFNKRAEMWCKLKNKIDEGLALPDGEHGYDLRADLTVPLVDYKHPSGKARLESKDSMRKRGMRSPDLGDAVAMLFAFPVAPRARDRDGDGEVVPMAPHSTMLHDYDPMKAL